MADSVPDNLILAVNCGSSSIKFKLYSHPDLRVLFSGSASNVEQAGSAPVIDYVVHDTEAGKPETDRSEEEEEKMPYEDVFERIIKLLEENYLTRASSSDDTPVNRSRDLIRLVAHRVVHGGTEKEPMVLWPGHEEGMELLDKLSEFAPLHNHRSVLVVKACLDFLPNAHQVLCYDTLFHQTLPPQIYTYPIAPSTYDPPVPLRKYGMHGLSYAAILNAMSKELGKPEDQCNLIVAHLGSGASCCLIRGGKSEDTTMGLSPLDGLVGGTRTGHVDPTLIFHHTPEAGDIVDYKGVRITRAEMILNTNGGLQALCGTSNMGTILAKLPPTYVPSGPTPPPASATDPSQPDPYTLAYSVFLDRLLGYLGSYLLKLLGSPEGPTHIDGLVFSGGIGERGARLRKDVLRWLEWTGAKVDEKANDGVGKGKVVWRITEEGSKIPAFVCFTDEELQCAKMAGEFMDDAINGNSS